MRALGVVSFALRRLRERCSCRGNKMSDLIPGLFYVFNNLAWDLTKLCAVH